MDDPVKPAMGKQLLDARSVRHIHLDETEVFVGYQPVQPTLFETYIVVVVEVVEPHYFVTAGQQPQRGCHADEAGRT